METLPPIVGLTKQKLHLDTATLRQHQGQLERQAPDPLTFDLASRTQRKLDTAVPGSTAEPITT